MFISCKLELFVSFKNNFLRTHTRNLHRVTFNYIHCNSSEECMKSKIVIALEDADNYASNKNSLHLKSLRRPLQPNL